jgi:hypothetical protein
MPNILLTPRNQSTQNQTVPSCSIMNPTLILSRLAGGDPFSADLIKKRSRDAAAANLTAY